MRELAIHSADDYEANRKRLNPLFTLQSFALLAFGIEVGALLQPCDTVRVMARRSDSNQKPPPSRPPTSTPNPSHFEKKGGRPWGGGQEKTARPSK